MYHHLAPLAAFIGLLLAIAGSVMYGQNPSLLAFALVAIGSVLNVTAYL